MYNMYIVPLTHNLSITSTYMIRTKKITTTPKHVIPQQAYAHTHACSIYRVLTLKKNSLCTMQKRNAM